MKYIGFETEKIGDNTGVAVLSGPIIDGEISSETLQRLGAGAQLAEEATSPLLLLGGSAGFMEDEIAKGRVSFDLNQTYCSDRYYFRETAGKALEAKDIAIQIGLNGLHLVTSDYHVNRTLKLFERIIPNLDISITGIRVVGMSEEERRKQRQKELFIRTPMENMLLMWLGYNGTKDGNDDRLARRLGKVADVRNRLEGLKPANA